MSDVPTDQGLAETAEPADGLAPSDVGPPDDERWLGAFLLAHRGKTFRLDAGTGWGVGRASAASAVVPTGVIDDVVRAVRQASAVAPERFIR